MPSRRRTVAAADYDNADSRRQFVARPVKRFSISVCGNYVEKSRKIRKSKSNDFAKKTLSA